MKRKEEVIYILKQCGVHLYDEARYHYENYYPNKKFLITSLKIVGKVNRNKLYPFLKSELY